MIVNKICQCHKVIVKYLSVSVTSVDLISDPVKNLLASSWNFSCSTQRSTIFVYVHSPHCAKITTSFELDAGSQLNWSFLVRENMKWHADLQTASKTQLQSNDRQAALRCVQIPIYRWCHAVAGLRHSIVATYYDWWLCSWDNFSWCFCCVMWPLNRQKITNRSLVYERNVSHHVIISCK